MTNKTDRRTEPQRIQSYDLRGDARLPLLHRQWYMRSCSRGRGYCQPMDPMVRSTDNTASHSKYKSKSLSDGRPCCQQFFDPRNPTPAIRRFATSQGEFGPG